MNKSGSRGSASTLAAGDVVGIFILSVLMLTLSYYRSRNCAFWGDEILGVEVLGRPNFSSLLDFWRHGIDSSGIWFYVFGRPWAKVFGFSEVSIRMYSAVGVTASAAVLWTAARRLYATLPVAAAISLVYAFFSPLRWQLANGRSYGLFILAATLVLYFQLLGEREGEDRPSTKLLLGTLCAYSLLNGSHVLGSLYAVAFLGIQVALDLRHRRWRPLLYVFALWSFLIVWFSRANINAMITVGKPSFWTVKPSFTELVAVHHLMGNKIAAVIAFLVLVGLLHFRFRRKRMPIYVILFGFVATDLFIFVYSRHSTSIYVDRYLLPFVIAFVLLLCELFTQLQEADAPWPRLRSGLPVLGLAFAAGGFFLPRLQLRFLPYPDYTARLLATIPYGLPIIDSDVGTFRDVEFYRHDVLSEQFLFPVDWEVALDPGTKGGVSGFHEVDRAKAMGIHAEDIQSTADVLFQKNDFIVLSSPSSPMWLKRRILENPVFSAVKLGTFDCNPMMSVEIWRVHRQ